MGKYIVNDEEYGVSWHFGKPKKYHDTLDEARKEAITVANCLMREFGDTDLKIEILEVVEGRSISEILR